MTCTHCNGTERIKAPDRDGWYYCGACDGGKAPPKFLSIDLTRIAPTGDAEDDPRRPAPREYILCAAIWADDGVAYPHQPKHSVVDRHDAGCIYADNDESKKLRALAESGLAPEISRKCKCPSRTNIERTGIVFCGRRHTNCFTAMLKAFPVVGEGPKATRGLSAESRAGKFQGFLTSHNRFVDRDEAGHIAFAAGQVDRDGLFLTSEDIY